jgi:hypothetical protein
MTIYYRSDTRSPEEIFAKGFSPLRDKGEAWWIHAAQVEAQQGKFGIDNKASDATSEFTVCMSTKFESAALFPHGDNKSVGEHVYIYAIALPDATQATHEKKERNIYLRNNIPSQDDIENYKNSYIIVYRPRSLNYITSEGKVEKLSYPASEFSLGDDIAEQMNLDNMLKSCISRPGFKQTKPIQDVLEKDEKDFLWKEITKENPLHKRKNNIVLLADENTPTNNSDMILDLHQLQSAQAGKIVNHAYKTGLFDQNTSAHAGWPLYAYEALAHNVPPENIIGAVKVHREEKMDVVIDKSASHPDKTVTSERKFTVEGDVRMNNNFISNQTLSVGRGGKERMIDVDYSKEKATATAFLERAAKETSMETPNVYFGLGGKTF